MTNNLYLYKIRKSLIIDLNKLVYIEKQYFENRPSMPTGWYRVKIGDMFITITEEEYKKLIEKLGVEDE